MTATSYRSGSASAFAVVALLAVLGVVGSALLYNAARSGSAAGASASPHIDHVSLPLHRTWRVVSVSPYEGLEEIELVKFDWPTADDPHLAFALSREGLTTGDQICLDHVHEIDTFWAHPVPAGGCAARVPARQ